MKQRQRGDKKKPIVAQDARLGLSMLKQITQLAEEENEISLGVLQRREKAWYQDE